MLGALWDGRYVSGTRGPAGRCFLGWHFQLVDVTIAGLVVLVELVVLMLVGSEVCLGATIVATVIRRLVLLLGTIGKDRSVSACKKGKRLAASGARTDRLLGVLRIEVGHRLGLDLVFVHCGRSGICSGGSFLGLHGSSSLGVGHGTVGLLAGLIEQLIVVAGVDEALLSHLLLPSLVRQAGARHQASLALREALRHRIRCGPPRRVSAWPSAWPSAAFRQKCVLGGIAITFHEIHISK